MTPALLHALIDGAQDIADALEPGGSETDALLITSALLLIADRLDVIAHMAGAIAEVEMNR